MTDCVRGVSRAGIVERIVNINWLETTHYCGYFSDKCCAPRVLFKLSQEIYIIAYVQWLAF